MAAPPPPYGDPDKVGGPPPPGAYPPPGPQQPAMYPPPGGQQPASYPPPGGQQPGMYPPPGGQQPVVYPPPGAVVIQQQNVHFDRFPVQVTCSNCRQLVQTRVQYEIGTGTIIIGLFLCICAFCIDFCKDAVHVCPSCNHVLGRKNLI